MVFFVIIAFLIAFFLKRNPFQFVRNISFKWPLIILLSFGAQIVLSFVTLETREKIVWVFVLTFIGVIFGLYINRRIPGVKWICIGAALNLIALLLNGGTMPVSKKALQLTGQAGVSFATDARHHLMGDSVYWILGDWIPVIRYALSPGDILAGIGIAILIIKHSEKRSDQDEGK
ncbi:DUF5317 family protein [Bacillus sp. BRMEA1]|uniref:DUF5317 family protein n=1 Tax=Neobacillus endophyticus TaxID=2738405 RepID=UPI001566E07B|nr:DUF5317 family protein [Neobacillus endophyticus]NRD76889.1 DUF5317 family protein [Neobacillus endophyticus]